MNIQVNLSLTDEEFTLLWRKASARIDLPRDDPRKAWTEKEKKEVIRRYVLLLVYNSLY